MLLGRFERHVGEAGSKREVQPWTTFVEEVGMTGLLLHMGGNTIPLDATVTVEAWPVGRSPSVAHMGGRHLWVHRVKPN